MSNSKTVEALKGALRHLPGVGPKNAQRMAFYLLEKNRSGAREIADALTNALDHVKTCARCNTFSDEDVCSICLSEKRDHSLLCVTETPADLEAIEESGAFTGLYFVLMGRLSPLEGIGPDDLAFAKLLTEVKSRQIDEVILATNITAEGDTTADYTEELLKPHVNKVTRLARGLPVGGELEYMDHKTLSAALKERRQRN